jgi:hypothetical protein
MTEEAKEAPQPQEPVRATEAVIIGSGDVRKSSDIAYLQPQAATMDEIVMPVNMAPAAAPPTPPAEAPPSDS